MADVKPRSALLPRIVAIQFITICVDRLAEISRLLILFVYTGAQSDLGPRATERFCDGNLFGGNLQSKGCLCISYCVVCHAWAHFAWSGLRISYTQSLGFRQNAAKTHPFHCVYLRFQKSFWLIAKAWLATGRNSEGFRIGVRIECALAVCTQKHCRLVFVSVFTSKHANDNIRSRRCV